MALREGLPNVSIHKVKNGIIFAAGTVGPCMTLTLKNTPQDPKGTLSAPILDLLDIAPMSL